MAGSVEKGAFDFGRVFAPPATWLEFEAHVIACSGVFEFHNAVRVDPDRAEDEIMDTCFDAFPGEMLEGMIRKRG